MASAALDVHSLINRKGEKWLVIDHNKYRKVRFTNRGKVLWRCIRKYCPAKVYTLNIEDNIVTFAKLHHNHDHVFRNNRGVKRNYMDDFSECSRRKEDSFDKIEGSRAKDIKPDFNGWQTIKEEKGILDESKADKISSSKSAPKNLNKIRFPYMEVKECKVEISPGVWILEQVLEFVRNNLKMDPAEMTRNLLWYLIGPKYLKDMSLSRCEETGTVQFPEEIYMVVQLFVAENCSEDSQLSLKDFIQCIKDIFDDAARSFKLLRKSEENSGNRHKRRKLCTGEH